jgi:hypothetical protein
MGDNNHVVSSQKFRQEHNCVGKTRLQCFISYTVLTAPLPIDAGDHHCRTVNSQFV